MAYTVEVYNNSYIPEFTEEFDAPDWQTALIAAAEVAKTIAPHPCPCGSYVCTRHEPDSSAPDSECYTLPNGECVAPVCKLHGGVRVLPGHPVKDGTGYDCCCGACLALPARRAELDDTEGVLQVFASVQARDFADSLVVHYHGGPEVRCESCDEGRTARWNRPR